MSVTDYPDFQRVDQWVGAPFVNAVQAAMPNNTSFGPFYVGSWEALSFEIFQSAGAGTAFTVTFNFRATPTGAVVSTVAYNAQNALFVRDVIPVHSLYVTVTIGGWAGTRDFSVTLLPRRGFDPATRLASGDALLYVGSTAIGAGATLLFTLTTVAAAHCTMSVHTDAVAWSAILYAFTNAGVKLGAIGVLGSAGGRTVGTTQVDLPPFTCAVEISNFDAAGKTILASVVPSRY